MYENDGFETRKLISSDVFSSKFRDAWLIQLKILKNMIKNDENYEFNNNFINFYSNQNKNIIQVLEENIMQKKNSVKLIFDKFL